jgi:hypothetical protein
MSWATLPTVLLDLVATYIGSREIAGLESLDKWERTAIVQEDSLHANERWQAIWSEDGSRLVVRSLQSTFCLEVEDNVHDIKDGGIASSHWSHGESFLEEVILEKRHEVAVTSTKTRERLCHIPVQDLRLLVQVSWNSKQNLLAMAYREFVEVWSTRPRRSKKAELLWTTKRMPENFVRSVLWSTTGDRLVVFRHPETHTVYESDGTVLGETQCPIPLEKENWNHDCTRVIKCEKSFVAWNRANEYACLVVPDKEDDDAKSGSVQIDVFDDSRKKIQCFHEGKSVQKRSRWDWKTALSWSPDCRFLAFKTGMEMVVWRRGMNATQVEVQYPEANWSLDPGHMYNPGQKYMYGRTTPTILWNPVLAEVVVVTGTVVRMRPTCTIGRTRKQLVHPSWADLLAMIQKIDG